MQSSSRSALLAVAALAVTACGTTIRPGERGLAYRALSTPALQTRVLKEGFYWQWPWNDIVKYDVTWQSRTEDVDVLTSDDLHVATRVTVTFRPDDRQLYRLINEIGKNYYADVIRPNFVTIARSEFAKHAHNMLPKEAPVLEGAIVARLRDVIGDKPILLDRVSIDHVAFDPSVSASISKKLATQQALEQKGFEVTMAERDAEIARTRARGEADAVRARAEGEATAITVRGEAQAKAQAAIGKTLTRAYLQYKAFDNPATRYYFVPTGKDGMPIILNTDGGPSPRATDPTYSSIAP